ncbi:MAG: class I SAM-dependent RNA methyltransferase, partial [Spirochaetaceae bacterium]|nr:class I SAM-dependent RNA methyltransferase [Spirochaetaceae bacterium]
MSDTPFAIALCAIGLEKVCKTEMERLGLAVENAGPGRLRLDLETSAARLSLSPDALLLRANLCSRTAERVLIEAARFRAEDFDQLFEGVRSVPWERFLRREDRLVVERVRIHESRLSAQTSVQSVAHKAAYERLCGFYGLERMPETGTTRSARIYLDGDECVLGLDSSGEALHKRGYRRAAGEAPLKETIAAGILLLSGWGRRYPLFDPFCGSGTIGIEAALFAADRAPGLGRAFAFEDMPFALNGGAPSRLTAEVEAAKARVRRDADYRIVLTDADPRALEAARANASRAGVAAGLVFRKGRAEEAVPEYEEGYLLCNPPYGDRLGSVPEAEALYRRLGEVAGRFDGWSLGFVTNRADFGSFFGAASP